MILVLTACQKKVSLNYSEWSVGAPERAKTALLSLPTGSKTEITYQNKKIEFSRQLQNNIPVYGSFVKVIRDRSNVVSVQANTIDEKNLKAKDTSSANQSAYSKEIAKAGANFNKVEILSVEPVVFVEDSKAHYYTLVSLFDRTGAPYEVFFDENSKIIKIKNTGAEFSDVTASVYPEGPKLSQLTEMLLSGLKTDPTISNSQLTVTSEAPKKITLGSGALKFDPQDDRFDQLQAFYYIDKTMTWISSVLKVQLNPLNAVVWMGYPEKTNSAFYFQQKIRLGKGDDQAYANIAHDATIVSHETFHAMIEGLARLPYEGEGGSLNEAFADFFTCLMLNRPYLGESSYLKGPYKRSLVNTSNLSEKNGGLYHDSLIVSGTLWELKEKLGVDKARALALEALVRLNPVSNFSSFSEKIRTVGAEQLSTDDLMVLQQTLANRGF
jgi:Zn-dependent metalloprotease